MSVAAVSANKPTAGIATERVLVLDFGAQYAQLIARRVREQHVYCEIVRHDITAARVRELAPRGIDSVRRAGERVCRGGAEVRSGDFRFGHSGAGHLLRDAADVRGAGRRSEEQPGAGIWPGALHDHAGEQRRATNCLPRCRARRKCG